MTWERRENLLGHCPLSQWERRDPEQWCRGWLCYGIPTVLHLRQEGLAQVQTSGWYHNRSWWNSLLVVSEMFTLHQTPTMLDCPQVLFLFLLLLPSLPPLSSPCTDSPPRLLEGCLLCMLVSQLGSGSHWVTTWEDSRGYRVEWVGTDQTKASRFCFSAETVLLLLPVLHIHLLCGVFPEERTHEH